MEELHSEMIGDLGIICMPGCEGFVEKVERFVEGMFANPHRFRTKTLPSAGALMREEDYGEQLNLLGE